jgi:asparagine synthase (glutamine-hydrolysing)
VCGICGIVDLSPEPVRERDLLWLRDQLAHRGPDDAGAFLEPDAGLGARRLSILDLSPRGHMPMPDEEHNLWITYNGEVYNFAELREQLEKRGHRFESDGDTEVVLRAYCEWGEACVEHLIGMFAFAIWDRRRRRLFAARDRLGVKPLFYARQGARLVFASEIHPLYRFVPPSAETIDPLALDYYLGFGYAPPDRCFVRGLSKLPPAHTLVFDGQNLRVERYWRVSFAEKRHGSLEETLDALDEHLQTAVVRRLRSDVPLGCFLSGGIDSGLVTAIAARHSASRVNTFSVGFGGTRPEDDERPLARLVAERYGTAHRELVVNSDHRAVLPRILWHVGEPFADLGAVPMYEISRQARAHITVALSGDGGDESFAGYPNVRAAQLAQQLRGLVPRPLRGAIARAASFPPLASRVHTASALSRFLRHYVDRSVLGQFDFENQWSSSWRGRLYTPQSARQLADATAGDIVAAELAAAGPLEDADLHLFTDLHLRLAGDYLTKVDIAANMASLEVRSPFLDHELVEFAARIPLSQKLLRGRQKGLLRLLAERYLPEPLIRQPKRGFGPRLGEWLRGDWSDMVRDLSGNSESARAGILRSETVRQVVEEHLRGRDHAVRVWNLACLELWWRLFVSRSLSPGESA